MPKSLKTRIQNKHDIEANWLLASNFVPLAGEIIIYDPDETHDLPRVKIGDGETLVNNLKFIDADLVDAIDSKADSEHGTHVSFSTADPVMDGVAAAGSANTVARSDHKHPIDTSRASQADLAEHINDSDTHIGADDRVKFEAAYEHSQTAHAPADVLNTAKLYTDTEVAAVKNELLNGAGEAYDTLKELGDLINENQDALEALELVAAGKADKDHKHDEYATETYVDEKIAEIPVPDVSSQIDNLISCGTADPSANITSKFYFKYATE